MEQLLHYVWKHKMFPLKPLKTADGEAVEVIDSGLHNHNAGPDFFNAKVHYGLVTSRFTIKRVIGTFINMNKMPVTITSFCTYVVALTL